MCCKATPEWNIKKEIILKIRRIKVEKKKDENIQLFYLEQMQLAKFDHRNFNPSWSWKYIFWSFIFTYHQILYIWILEENPRALMFFSVNELE